MTLEKLGELAFQCLKVAGFRVGDCPSPLVNIEVGSHIELMSGQVSIMPTLSKNEEECYEVIWWTHAYSPGHPDPLDICDTLLLTTANPYEAVKKAVLALVEHNLNVCCEVFGYLLIPETE